MSGKPSVGANPWLRGRLEGQSWGVLTPLDGLVALGWLLGPAAIAVGQMTIVISLFAFRVRAA